MVGVVVWYTAVDDESVSATAWGKDVKLLMPDNSLAFRMQGFVVRKLFSKLESYSYNDVPRLSRPSSSDRLWPLRSWYGAERRENAVEDHLLSLFSAGVKLCITSRVSSSEGRGISSEELLVSSWTWKRSVYLRIQVSFSHYPHHWVRSVKESTPNNIPNLRVQENEDTAHLFFAAMGVRFGKYLSTISVHFRPWICTACFKIWSSVDDQRPYLMLGFRDWCHRLEHSAPRESKWFKCFWDFEKKLPTIWLSGANHPRNKNPSRLTS